MLNFIFKRLILYPKLSFFTSFVLCAILSVFAFKLEFDASAESLFLEDDEDLRFYRQISEFYQNDNFLILALEFKDKNPFSKENLKLIQNLTQDLENIKGVQRILSLTNIPLLQSQDKTELKDLLMNIPTLASNADINLSKAKLEILNSPFYQNNLISKDGTITALLIYLESLNSKAQEFEDKLRLEQIKKLVLNYESADLKLYMSGVSLIADEMITYIKDDLLQYSFLLVLFLSLVLWFFFKDYSLVFLILFNSFISLCATSGLFALLGFKINAISSNYLAFMFIISISLMIHLIVHFIHLSKNFPYSLHLRLILRTLLAKAGPSFYAIFTTALGFLSLIFSNIKPLINLGLMMSIGISLSLVLSFVFFATWLCFMPNHYFYEPKFNARLLKKCALFALKHQKMIFITALLVLVLACFGVGQLRVENSFVNYFKQSSNINQSLSLIDNKLGGTMPLELILQFKDKNIEQSEPLDSFEEEFNALSQEQRYFFTADKIRIIKKIHQYFQDKQFIGSILSFESLLNLGKKLNENKELDDFSLAFLYENLPPHFKQDLLLPFVNVAKNEFRFVMRIQDSNPNLKRAAFIEQIHKDLSLLLKDEALDFHLSGIMILYNNMLQSLFASQFNTLIFVVMAIFFVFALVFQSFKLAFIGIIANLIPLSLVFAIMGFLDLPLDLMSITIAAICIGIGVDDSIHYIYRFKEELKQKSLKAAIFEAHLHIGSALFESKIALILGFSVMMSSHFIPTIYFGFLTLLVMSFLLLGSLILLPALLSGTRLSACEKIQSHTKSIK